MTFDDIPLYARFNVLIWSRVSGPPALDSSSAEEMYRSETAFADFKVFRYLVCILMLLLKKKKKKRVKTHD